MFNKNFFFKNYFFNKKRLNQNLQKTNNIFNSLKKEINNFEIPLLQSFEKDYVFDFSKKTVKKFSKYKNIVVIGMGGSILGTKTIYSFFKYSVKKKK